MANVSQSELNEQLAVKRTERGWAGHFIFADRCLFRRNTLLELGDIRIVVSSVGLMKNTPPFDKEGKFTTIGYDRHFETMAFMAQRVDNRYWDADVSRQIYFDSPWAIPEPDAVDRANDMHEAVVNELEHKLMTGNIACIDG